MIRSREVFPTFLEHALLANRVLEVLKQEDIGEEEKRKAMDQAIRFIDVVLQGKLFTEKREVSERSYQAALAYGEAIKAVSEMRKGGNRNKKGQGFDKFLQELRHITEALRDNKQVDKDARNALCLFFSSMRDIAFSARTRTIERLQMVE